MEIVDQIKASIVYARQNSQTVRKDVLQVALGEIQLLQSRTGVKPPDDVIFGIIRKMVASNNEVLAELMKRGAINEIVKLEEENEILTEYLPPEMSVLDLVLSEDVRGKITADPSKNVGKLIGEIIAYVKGTNRYTDGKNVKKAIDLIKAEIPA